MASALTLMSATVPAVASADFTSSLGISPSTTVVGANPELNLSLSVSGSPEVKSLTVTLPQGLHIGPGAVPNPCSLADAATASCAPSSQIGSVAATALGGVAATGQLFMTEPPASGYAAGVALVLGLTGSADIVIAQGALTLSNSGTNQPNQKLIFSEIPRLTSSSATFALTELSMTFNGWSEDASHALVTNPSTCPTSALTATSVATAYDDSVSQSSASYPTTGCNDLPFTPSFDESFSDPNAGHSTRTTFSLRMPLGNSSMKRLVLKFPSFEWSHFSALGSPADMCPSSSLPNPSVPVFDNDYS
ncbi:MAG: hypothetical protein WAP35_07480 [Solirubrobacterales bacterium]